MYLPILLPILFLIKYCYGGENSLKLKQQLEEVCALDGILDLGDEVEVDTRKELVERFVGDNYLVEMIKDKTCDQSANFSSCIFEKYKEKVSVKAGLHSAGIPCALAVLILFIILIPCVICRCWRRLWCCLGEPKKPRAPGKIIRGLMLGSLILITILAVVFSVLGGAAAGVVDGGIKSAWCEVYKFVDVVLNGQESNDTNNVHKFIGINPAVDKVHELSKQLESGSPFLTEINQIIETTEDLEFAVEDLKGFLSVIEKTLGNPENYDVGIWECKFCKSCCSSDGEIEDVKDTLNKGMAVLLTKARGTVKEHLEGDEIVNLRNTIKTAMDLVDDVQTKLDTQISTELLDNKDMFISRVDSQFWVTIVITAFVVIPSILLLLAGFCACIKYTPQRGRIPQPKIVLSACCCSCFYAFITLILAGVLLLFAYPFGMSCITLSDIPSLGDNVVNLLEFSDKMGPTNDSNETSSDSNTIENLRNVINTCLKRNGDGKILDVMKNSNNESISDIVMNIADDIVEKFDSISGGVPASDPSHDLGNQAPLTKLVSGLKALGDIYTPNPDRLKDLRESDLSYTYATEDYQTIPPTEREDLYVIAATATQECSNRQFEGETFLGTDHFINAAKNSGVDMGINACSDLTIPVTQRLRPWGNHMNLRFDLRNKADYMCNTYSLTKIDGAYKYVLSDAHLCGWNDYLNEVQKFSTTLQIKIDSVDRLRASCFDKIFVAMYKAVKDHLLSHVMTITRELNCRIVGQIYNGMLDSLCWSFEAGVIAMGWSYLAVGVIFWIAFILLFIIWRYLKDNSCLAKQGIVNGEKVAILK